MAFFFEHYVPASRFMGPGGVYLSNLCGIYLDTFPSSALHRATSAVALIVLSQFPTKAHLRQLAVNKYCEALGLLSNAVGDPIEAKTDATIMCAMLMVFYEVGWHSNDIHTCLVAGCVSFSTTSY